MENSPNQSEVQKPQTTAIRIVAYIFLISFIIAEIVTMVLVALKILSWFDLLSVSISYIIQLILLFSLDNAIQRITVLENALLKKGVIEEKEIQTETISEQDIELAENGSKIDLADAGIKFCKECGYQLFPEDTECPNCGAIIEDNNNSF